MQFQKCTHDRSLIQRHMSKRVQIIKTLLDDGSQLTVFDILNILTDLKGSE